MDLLFTSISAADGARDHPGAGAGLALLAASLAGAMADRTDIVT